MFVLFYRFLNKFRVLYFYTCLYSNNSKISIEVVNYINSFTKMFSFIFHSLTSVEIIIFCLLVMLFITFNILDVCLVEFLSPFSKHAFLDIILTSVSIFLYFLYSYTLTALINLIMQNFSTTLFVFSGFYYAFCYPRFRFKL